MLRQVALIACVALFTVISFAPRSDAASAFEIDAGVRATLDKFFYEIPGDRDLSNKSVGKMLRSIAEGFRFWIQSTTIVYQPKQNGNMPAGRELTGHAMAVTRKLPGCSKTRMQAAAASDTCQ